MRRRFIQKDGELIEVGLDYSPDPKADYHVMPDIESYVSMADGAIVNSRSSHRENLKRNNCFEVGNECLTAKPADLRKTGVKEALVESVQRAKEKHGSRNVERAMTDALNTAYEIQRRR